MDVTAFTLDDEFAASNHLDDEIDRATERCRLSWDKTSNRYIPNAESECYAELAELIIQYIRTFPGSDEYMQQILALHLSVIDAGEASRARKLSIIKEEATVRQSNAPAETKKAKADYLKKMHRKAALLGMTLPEAHEIS